MRRRLSKMVPEGLKPVLRALYSLGIPLSRGRHMASVEIIDYWKTRGGTDKEFYLTEDAINDSNELVRMISDRVPLDSQILEIGCGFGRNLHLLEEAGFVNLHGIDVGLRAFETMREIYPETWRRVNAYSGPIESIVPKLETERFDLVFSIYVLPHISSESEWVFREIARVTKKTLITIEDETRSDSIHHPRNYLEVFAPLGLEQVWMRSRPSGLAGQVFYRVFEKRIGRGPNQSD